MEQEEKPIENQPQKTDREKIVDRLKGKHPDRSFETDEEIYGGINEDFNESDEAMKGYKDNEDKLLNLFNSSDRRGVEVFQRWKDGENPIGVIIELFGDDAIDFINDPSNKEKFDAAYKKWADRQAKDKELGESATANAQASLDNLEKVKGEGGYSAEQANAAFNFLVGLQEELLSGVVSEDTWKLAFNALNHDMDVEVARQEGNVDGRNANITEQLRKPVKTSAPMLGSAGGGAGIKPMPQGGMPQSTGSAWDRGKRK